MTAAHGSPCQTEPAQASNTTAVQPEFSDPARDRLRRSVSEKSEPSTASPARIGTSVAAAVESAKSVLMRPKVDTTAAEMAAEDSRRHSEWAAVAKAMGGRYHDCKFSGFEFYGTTEEQSRQKGVIDSCRQMADNFANLDSNSGLVLFGPPGTGKDHILAAMLRAACMSGRSVKWLNGLDFFGDMRDRMDKESPESEIIKDLSKPDILAISDPLPPWGPLTAFQAQTLFRVIDRRYRQEKPIWVTVNVAGGHEASERIGAAVVDRLKERSLSVFCNWPSYRARQK